MHEGKRNKEEKKGRTCEEGEKGGGGVKKTEKANSNKSFVYNV
jgi:hypothetical protein